MKSKINTDIKSDFIRAFNNAAKQYEAEMKQQPTQTLVNLSRGFLCKIFTN